MQQRSYLESIAGASVAYEAKGMGSTGDTAGRQAKQPTNGLGAREERLKQTSGKTRAWRRGKSTGVGGGQA